MLNKIRKLFEWVQAPNISKKSITSKEVYDALSHDEWRSKYYVVDSLNESWEKTIKIISQTLLMRLYELERDWYIKSEYVNKIPMHDRHESSDDLVSDEEKVNEKIKSRWNNSYPAYKKVVSWVSDEAVELLW